MDSNSPNSPKMLNGKERQTIALQLRKAGANYQSIADHLGVSVRMVYKYVRKAIDQQAAHQSELAQDIIDLEISRLDMMLYSLKAGLKNGNVSAIDRALKIQERRSRLLGLDAPTKIAPTSPDGKSQFSLLADAIMDNQEGDK